MMFAKSVDQRIIARSTSPSTSVIEYFNSKRADIIYFTKHSLIFIVEEEKRKDAEKYSEPTSPLPPAVPPIPTLNIRAVGPGAKKLQITHKVALQGTLTLFQ